MTTIFRRSGALTLGTVGMGVVLVLSAPTLALAEPAAVPRPVRVQPAGPPPPPPAMRAGAVYADVPRRERAAAGPGAVDLGILHLGGTEQLA